jgi:hypothetical protein
MKLKAVYFNEARVGSARTWHEVAVLVGEILDRHITMREILRYGSEGPAAFYVAMQGIE